MCAQSPLDFFLSHFNGFWYTGVCYDILKLYINDFIVSQKGSNGDEKLRFNAYPKCCGIGKALSVYHHFSIRNLSLLGGGDPLPRPVDLPTVTHIPLFAAKFRMMSQRCCLALSSFRKKSTYILIYFLVNDDKRIEDFTSFEERIRSFETFGRRFIFSFFHFLVRLTTRFIRTGFFFVSHFISRNITRQKRKTILRECVF